MELSIFTDGGSRGNPGSAGCGVVIKKKSGHGWQTVGEYKKFIGHATNNQAEYEAAILALEKARELGGTQLFFYADSKLLVEQLKGNYRVKNPGLAKLFVRVHNLRMHFSSIKFFHIPREKNTEADKLANEAMDVGTGASFSAS